MKVLRGWINLQEMYSVKNDFASLSIKVYYERKEFTPKEQVPFFYKRLHFLKGLAVTGEQTGSHKYCIPLKQWQKICKEYSFLKDRRLDFNVNYKFSCIFVAHRFVGFTSVASWTNSAHFTNGPADKWQILSEPRSAV